jgi:cyclophilin family peptidyl-prolyl cis-trans isomerase
VTDFSASVGDSLQPLRLCFAPLRLFATLTLRHRERVLTSLLGCLFFLVSSEGPALAQESNAEPAGDAKARFETKFTEYKDVVRQIEKLRNDFQEADDAARQAINGELVGHVKRAKAILYDLVDAATDAYRAAPNLDPKITELLLAVADHYAIGRAMNASGTVRNGGDQYEKALTIINALIEGGADAKQLPVWGVVCAFVTNDHGLAQKYFEQAKDQDAFAAPATVDDSFQHLTGRALQYSESLDKYREMWAKEEEIRAAEAKADDLPRVKLATTKGDIVLELFENEAPTAVANFITLVKQGFYDGLTFHRVLSEFMAQGGCPEGTGSGGPGYHIRCECNQPNHRNHFRGSLSMAHAGPDTGGSQFFLTFVPTEVLDGDHTVFGRVIEGMEVLGEIQRRDPDDAVLPKPDQIVKAEVIRDRGHDYSFEKLPE